MGERDLSHEVVPDDIAVSHACTLKNDSTLVMGDALQAHTQRLDAAASLELSLKGTSKLICADACYTTWNAADLQRALQVDDGAECVPSVVSGCVSEASGLARTSSTVPEEIECDSEFTPADTK